MKLTPLADNIVGRMVDIHMSRGGLELPTSDIKNVTYFMRVDDVGPDVTKCKPGDVILYLAMGHVYLRDGTHWGIVSEKNLIALVTGLDPKTIVIEGEQRQASSAGNGGSALIT